MSKGLDQDWLRGLASLGAAAGWTPEEIRLVADLGYGLAEQGRSHEALAVFEGLAALAPSTGYFQSALGALRLRLGDLDAALGHLNSALEADPNDVSALVNRGEALMKLGKIRAASTDLQKVLLLFDGQPSDSFLIRARALLARIEQEQGATGRAG